jgi:hypothetical protein
MYMAETYFKVSATPSTRRVCGQSRKTAVGDRTGWMSNECLGLRLHLGCHDLFFFSLSKIRCGTVICINIAH